MSTTRTEGPDLMAALKEAIEKHAKLQLLAAQLPARLAEAAAVVEGAYQALGITPPGGLAAGRARAANGETEAAVLSALPGTLAEISDASGLPRSRVSTCLSQMRKKGTVVATGEPRRQVYHHAEEAPADER